MLHRLLSLLLVSFERILALVGDRPGGALPLLLYQLFRGQVVQDTLDPPALGFAARIKPTGVLGDLHLRPAGMIAQCPQHCVLFGDRLLGVMSGRFVAHRLSYNGHDLTVAPVPEASRHRAQPETERREVWA